MHVNGGVLMKNNHYESPIVTLLYINEDVIMASPVLDGGDKGIGYDELFSVGGNNA